MIHALWCLRSAAVDLHVSTEVGAMRKLVATCLAGGWPDARMQQLVAPQVAPSDEAHPTLSTHLSPLPRVREPVAFHHAQERETLPAVVTHALETPSRSIGTESCNIAASVLPLSNRFHWWLCVSLSAVCCPFKDKSGMSSVCCFSDGCKLLKHVSSGVSGGVLPTGNAPESASIWHRIPCWSSKPRFTSSPGPWRSGLSASLLIWHLRWLNRPSLSSAGSLCPAAPWRWGHRRWVHRSSCSKEQQKQRSPQSL